MRNFRSRHSHLLTFLEEASFYIYLVSPWQATVSKVYHFSMPPKRTRTRKRTQTSADEGPSSQRSRRLSTRQSTMASQSMASTPIASTGSTSEISTPSSADSVQTLYPDLIHLSSSQAPPDSATTLVNEAIAAAYSHITGAPQLLPTSTVVSSDTPGQIFLSTC